MSLLINFLELNNVVTGRKTITKLPYQFDRFGKYDNWNGETLITID